jgi:flagellar basal-body rod protein FlgG
LATAEGYPVRSVDGTPLKLDPAKPVEITSDGSVLQRGVLAGRLAIVDFDAGALVKRGGAYFQAVDPSRPPSGSVSTSVEQGRLETSNGGAAEAAVRLVAVMRQFEMLQKAAETAGEMNRKAVAEVAKVGA